MDLDGDHIVNALYIDAMRCVVLKHIKGWSYRELRASLLYRRFTRFYEDPIPDYSNLCRAFALFGKQGTEQIHQRVVQ